MADKSGIELLCQASVGDLENWADAAEQRTDEPALVALAALARAVAVMQSVAEHRAAPRIPHWTFDKSYLGRERRCVPDYAEGHTDSEQSLMAALAGLL